jgi:photosystem II stability/assembly factor-like uncharacterized protein
MTSAAAHSVQGLAVGETGADIIYQAVGRSYSATDAGRGIWRSMNGGATWSQVLPNVNFGGNDDLRWQGECIAITPGSLDQEIFAISLKNGLWRSSTGGGSASWSKQNGTAFDGMSGHVVQMHPSFPNDVFVGGVKGTATSALFKGTRGTGGTITWSAVTVNAATTSVTRLARLPGGVMFAAVQDGSANRFYKSNSTGTTWTNITTTVLGGLTANGPVGMCHVLRDGVTIVLGWIGGPTRRSTDAGASWNVINVGFKIFAIDFPTPDKGFAVGEDGLILQTTNGGDTWEQHNFPTTDNLYAIHFYDADTGYAVGGTEMITGLILKTTDGGASWHKQFIPSNWPLYAVATTGNCASTGGLWCLLFGTTNGGIQVSTGPWTNSLVLNSIIFPNPSDNKIMILNKRNPTGETEISICMVTGRSVISEVVKNQESVEIDVSALPPGTYLVKIQSGESIEVKKLVIL